jgi:hypothetical protein
MSFGKMEGDASDWRIAPMLQEDEADGPFLPPGMAGHAADDTNHRGRHVGFALARFPRELGPV